MKNKKSKTGFLVLAVLLCLGIVWVCTITGAASVSISDANRILLNKLFHLNVSLEEISKGNITIIWNIRFPRIILGFITGAALAVSGAGYQGIFKNPMADPFVLGISSGAALGAAVGIVCHFTFRIGVFNSTMLLAFAAPLPHYSWYTVFPGWAGEFQWQPCCCREWQSTPHFLH